MTWHLAINYEVSYPVHTGSGLLNIWVYSDMGHQTCSCLLVYCSFGACYICKETWNNEISKKNTIFIFFYLPRYKSNKTKTNNLIPCSIDLLISS